MTTTMTDLQTGRTFVFNEALPGRDAYEEALAQGFVGTRAAWLAYLRGFAFDPASADWESDRAYVANAAVRHAHKLWVAVAANSAVTPGSNPAVWQLLLDGSSAQSLTDAVAAALAHKGGAELAALDAEARRAAAALILTQTQAAAQALSPIEVLHPVALPIPAGWWDTRDRLLSGVSQRAIISNWQETSLLPRSLHQADLASSLFSTTAAATPAVIGGQVAFVDDTSRPRTVGPNLFPAGNFAAGTGYAGISAGVTIGAGVCAFSSVANNTGWTRNHTSAWTLGRLYMATITISGYSAGAVQLRVGSTGGSGGTFPAANGTWSIVLSGIASAAAMSLVAVGTTTLTASNLEIREITSAYSPLTQASSGQQPQRGTMPVTGVRSRFTQTENLSDAAWLKNGVTVASATGPGGATGAWVITASTGTSTKEVRQTPLISLQGQTVTLSTRVRRDGHAFLQALDTGDVQAFVNFDLAAGTVGTNGTKGAGSIVVEDATWCTISATFAANTVQAQRAWMLVPLATSGYGAALNATGTETITIFQPQVEVGSVRTAYQRVVSDLEVYEAGVANVDFLRFDTLDDTLAGPIAGGAGAVVVAGPGGIYAGPATIADGGTLTIGGASAALTINGAPNGILRAVGGAQFPSPRVFTWNTMPAMPTDEQMRRLELRNRARGGLGLLVEGPELITNGDFASAFTGWSDIGVGTRTLEIISGAARMVGTDGSNRARINQSFTAVAGAWYVIRATVVSRVAGLISLGIGTTSGGVSTLDVSLPAAPGEFNRIFAIPHATAHLSLRTGTTATDVTLDNISVRRIAPRELT